MPSSMTCGFALLQGLRRVCVSCDLADAGLADGCKDLILFLAHEWEGDCRKLSVCDGVCGTSLWSIG